MMIPICSDILWLSSGFVILINHLNEELIKTIILNVVLHNNRYNFRVSVGG